MKVHRNTIFYILTIGGFSWLIYWVIGLGEKNLHTGVHRILDSTEGNSPWANFLGSISENVSYPLSSLLIQIIVILITLRICGWFCKKIGQPAVIGEIISGIILGPSLLGYFSPEIFDHLFPAHSLGSIQMLSQIGLILFMFIVGMELNIKTVKNRAGDALLISHASIAFPFTCGVALAYLLYPLYEVNGISFLSFALFIGISMSITAFPVLARIVQERGIHKTHLGPIVITCAAVDDITAWCILAAVIAIVKAGSFDSSLFVIALAILYVIVMLKLIRPFLHRVAELQTDKGKLSKAFIGFFLIILFVSSYTTEVIGIHALFGAFMMGVIMPASPKFRSLFTSKIEDIVLVLFLPLFFVFTGLRTQIGLLNDISLWGTCLLITMVAIAGKLIGSTYAARFVHHSWKDSLTIGTLMNTRGLMELVVLNIGYDLGVLSPEIFAMMVIMALATTFMTSPMLNVIDQIFRKKADALSDQDVQRKHKILVFFESTSAGKKLLYLCNTLVKRQQKDSEVTMMFLTSENNIYSDNLEEEERNMFSQIQQESERISQPFQRLYAITSEDNRKVAREANKGEYDFLLLEVRASVFDGNLLGSIVNISTQLFRLPNRLMNQLFHPRKIASLSMPNEERLLKIISKSELPVGIFVDKGLTIIRNVFVPVLDDEDAFLGEYMSRMATNSYVRITLWDQAGIMDNSIEFIKWVREVKAVNSYLFSQWDNATPVSLSLLDKQDLVLMSLSSWKKLQNSDIAWKGQLPSSLVITN
jgi:Kef-type K+ transport system membrane component KefB